MLGRTLLSIKYANWKSEMDQLNRAVNLTITGMKQDLRQEMSPKTIIDMCTSLEQLKEIIIFQSVRAGVPKNDIAASYGISTGRIDQIVSSVDRKFK